MDEFQLKAFIYAADFSSLSKASLFMKVSQPTISRNIRQLEEQLNTSLLVRHGRGVALTEDGARFLDHAKIILAKMEGATRELLALRSEPVGEVKVGMPTAVGLVLVSRIARRAALELPNISLVVVESGSSVIMEWLVDGRIDVAVVHEPDPSSNVIVEEVWNQEVYVVGPPDGSLPKDRPITLAEISALPLVLSTPNQPPRRGFEIAMQEAGLPIRCVIEVNSAQLLRSLAMDGIGYSLLPLAYVLEDLAAGRLSAARIEGGIVKESLGIVTTTFHPATAATRAVARMIGEEFRSMLNKKYGGAVGLISGPSPFPGG